MRKNVIYIYFLLSIILGLVGCSKDNIVTPAQTFNLTVNNGYGSGTYQVGETVHIWSVAYDSTQTFGEWTGDISFLDRPKEWHTTMIMPNQNVSVIAVIDNMPTYVITYEVMAGLNNPKNVYYFFPTNPIGLFISFTVQVEMQEALYVELK